MENVKYALIGFGGIAENRIAKEGFACDKSRFAPLNGVELVGACDLNPARQAAAESLGLKWYANPEAILADPAIDAVFVATNNMSHAALASQALNAGKHVLVEKPLAATADDAAMLVRLAAEKKLSLGVDHMMVNNKLNIKAKKMIADNVLGTVNDCCFHMEFAYGYDSAEAATWRCSKWDEMGGPIGDVASHCFYLSEFLFDDVITDVAAVYYPKTMGIVVEDGAFVRFKMKKGLIASARVSFCDFRGGLGGTLTGLGYELYGSDAVLRGYGTMFQLSGYPDEPIPVRLELDKFSSQETITGVDEPTPNIYQGVILHHAQSIREGKPVNAEDGLRNVKLCYAAHESARNGGKWITV